jgi:hypothetical protein
MQKTIVYKLMRTDFKSLAIGTTKIPVDSISIIGRILGDFSQAVCFQTKYISIFLLRMSTTNAAWLPLEWIVQIVVCGTLMQLEGALKLEIDKKV